MKASAIMVCPQQHLPSFLSDQERDVLRKVLLAEALAILRNVELIPDLPDETEPTVATRRQGFEKGKTVSGRMPHKILSALKDSGPVPRDWFYEHWTGQGIQHVGLRRLFQRGWIQLEVVLTAEGKKALE